MLIELLRDDISLKKADLIQLKYCRDFLSKSNEILERNIEFIAAVDVSYYNIGGVERGVSCAVLWDYEKKFMVEYQISDDLIRFPYQPGFLGFRESKLLSEAICKLSIKPDIILCDSHGIIHPRRFGAAVQLGMALSLPSCGIAKNPFIGISNWRDMERIKGNKRPVLTKNGEIIGYAICLNDNMKPVFISRGFKTDLDMSLEVSLRTTKAHRQPEPLYLADQISREEIQVL
jgi:deoxyribonuclease V